MPYTPTFQETLEGTIIPFCKRVGGAELEELIIREFQKPGERPTPPRVYKFPSFLVVDRPFCFPETVFVHEELAIEGLRIVLPREASGRKDDRCKVVARVTNLAGSARCGIKVRATYIRAGRDFSRKTNFEGKCTFGFLSREATESLMLIVIGPPVQTEAEQKKVIKVL